MKKHFGEKKLEISDANFDTQVSDFASFLVI